MGRFRELCNSLRGSDDSRVNIAYWNTFVLLTVWIVTEISD